MSPESITTGINGISAIAGVLIRGLVEFQIIERKQPHNDESTNPKMSRARKLFTPILTILDSALVTPLIITPPETPIQAFELGFAGGGIGADALYLLVNKWRGRSLMQQNQGDDQQVLTN